MQITGFTVFIIQEEHEIITLVELRGRAHEAALKAIAKSKSPANYAFKKNNEILVAREHVKKRVQMGKEDLGDRVRAISDEEFEEIRNSAASFFRDMAEEKHHETKKAPPLKNATVREEKALEKKERANVKKYFDEHMKKENNALEKRSNDEKSERIKRFEERMKEKDEKIQEFRKNSR